METKDNILLAFLICASISLAVTSLYIQHFYLDKLPNDSFGQYMDHINFFTSTFAIISIFGTIVTCIRLAFKYG